MNWLGQKPDSETTPPSRSSNPPSTPTTAQAAPQHTPIVRETVASAPAPATTNRGASIGKSICVKGELTGSEDLAIDGKVEGKITLTGCRVTIGATGQVMAEIVAKSVVVAGQVKGSVRAEEKVEIAATGNLIGDVRSPRVALADGAKFKGSVDMDPGTSGGASTSSSASLSAKKKTDPLLTPEEAPMYAGAATE